MTMMVTMTPEVVLEAAAVATNSTKVDTAAAAAAAAAAAPATLWHRRMRLKKVKARRQAVQGAVTAAMVGIAIVAVAVGDKIKSSWRLRTREGL
jgi:hypothetical protein